MAVLSAVAFAAIYGVAVANPLGQAVDTAIMAAVARALGEPAWAQTVLDLVAPISVLAAAALLAAIALLRKRPVVAAHTFGVATVTPVAASVLRNWLDRPDYGVDDLLNSLPSGQAAALAGLVAAAWFVTARSWRVVWAVVGGATVAVTGLATIALQWHRPSDVAAAIALATFVAAIAAVSRGSGSAFRTADSHRVHRKATGQDGQMVTSPAEPRMTLRHSRR